MQKHLIRAALGSLLLVMIGLAAYRPPSSYFPAIDIETPDSAGKMVLRFLFDHQPTRMLCETVTASAAQTTLEACRGCRITRLTCDSTLSPEELHLFSEVPLRKPSGRMANGIVVFESESPAEALVTCADTELRSVKSYSPLKCYPANVNRPALPSPVPFRAWSPIVLAIAFFAAWLVGWLIVRYENLHARFSHDHIDGGPQKYHAHPTPRIGGLAVIIGLISAAGVLPFFDAIPVARSFGLLLLAGLPAFLGGLVEDVTKKVGVAERLLLTMLSGATAAWLIGAVLNRLDIPGVEQVLAVAPLAVAFTVFAVGGIANAVNIIDGYNGLAGGFSAIVLAGIVVVSGQVGDVLVFTAALCLLGAILGFLVWNWPGGKIFLGDGGAYLIGFLLAELSVLLVIDNPGVSPWFPLLILIHPIFETFYSIYRRKLRGRVSPGQPDNQHMHQLVHDKLIHHGDHGRPFSRNSRVAKYIWIPTAIMAALGALVFHSTSALATCAGAFCIFYVVFYRTLAELPLVGATARIAAPVIPNSESIDSPTRPQA